MTRPRPQPEEILKRFRELPNDLQDAIFSVEAADTIQLIGKKYKLTLDAVGELADETGYLMLGFTKPEDFVGNLQKRLRVDFETARGITQDLNVQIFAKVRESLKRAHAMEEDHVVPIPERPATTQPAAELPKGSPLGGPKNSPLEKTAPAFSPFEAKLQEKIFSAGKELQEARVQKIYPGGKDPYREPTS